MLTNTHAQLSGSTLYNFDFLVDFSSYNTLRERITEQYLKNIEIPGFRKGMAPREKALAKADLPYLENLVWNEVITRNYPEAEIIIRKKLEEEKRGLLSILLSQEPETIGEVEKEGFKFRLVTALLPDVDLEPISKITLKEPTAKDLPERINFEEYSDRESALFLRTFNEYQADESGVSNETSRMVVDILENNITDSTPTRDSKDVTLTLGISQFPPEFEKNLIGLKKGDVKEFEIKVFSASVQKDVVFKFKVTVHDLLAGKFQTLSDLFSNTEMVTKVFATEDDFKATLKETYEIETESILKDQKTKQAMSAAVANTGDIELDEEAITSETERIFGELSKNADPADAFNQARFPFVGVATNSNLKAEIEKYVRGEFKIAKLCLVIYYTKIDQKTSEEELNKFTKEIEKNPAQYGYPQDLKGDELRDRIFDNILRNKALEWILNTVTFE
jgi:trigger factor